MMQNRTRVKVCGITNVEDALGALERGVDALGFIFAESSPRYISPEDAREITLHLPPLVNCVGVFVDKDPVEIEEIIEYCYLNAVQLHGGEDPEYCRKLAHSVSPCRLIKAFRVGRETQASDFEPYEDAVSAYLLDTYVKGQEGGTGQTFDWQIIERLKLVRPLILAGGLEPENVVEAISAVRPFAIDVNSGVEEEPGKKDMLKLETLLAYIQRSAG